MSLVGLESAFGAGAANSSSLHTFGDGGAISWSLKAAVDSAVALS